jgi:hypothetical protein
MMPIGASLQHEHREDETLRDAEAAHDADLGAAPERGQRKSARATPTTMVISVNILMTAGRVALALERFAQPLVLVHPGGGLESRGFSELSGNRARAEQGRCGWRA